VPRFVLLTAFVAALGSLYPFAPTSPLPSSELLAFSQNGPAKAATPRKTVTKEGRLALIRRAQVWRPIDIPHLNLREGPQGTGGFQPNQTVTCDYAQRPKHGATRKFHCALPGGDVVKVRYGVHNGEVQASVLATRLLWALGFAADRVYPVRVVCRGCSADPWTDGGRRGEVHEFDPAVIERKPAGHQIWDDDDKKSGWSWPELDLVDPRSGGAPRAQRDALTLLAVFMQHTDSKSEQQRLICVDGFTPDGYCRVPFMMLHDVGTTFGHANFTNKNSTGSVNFQNWSSTPIWKSPKACIADMNKSHTGTLGDPRISEAGRKFLADLLVQLNDQQLHDLFDVAGVTRRSSESGSVQPVPVANWVAAFNQKRSAIVTNHCKR
jgi:hypothetical protein